MADIDPFDCFGSDDDGDGGDSVSSNKDERFSVDTYQRDPDCGVCSQLNAEKSLLMHVKNSNCNDDDQDVLSRCKLVQTTIDDFCEKRAWMMHIGPEKGLIIQDVLKEKLDAFVKANSEDEKSEEKPLFVCVELGTYCGYGSIWLARTLYEYSKKYTHIDFHLFTVEINPLFAQIAQEITDLCKLNDHVTILENDLLMSGETADVGLLLKEKIKQYSCSKGKDVCLDFLLIDHDKDSYLSDLKILEGHGMIKEGTVVAADNVIFAQIDNYISYMKKLDEEGIVSTRTEESFVEYSSPDVSNNNSKEALFKDGIVHSQRRKLKR